MTVAILWGFLALCAVLAATILLRVLTGEIRNRGLLATEPGGDMLPERVQAMIAAIGVPVSYAVLALDQARSAAPVTTLIDPPEWMLIAITGSQTLYIAGKLLRRESEARQ